ncbi:hypothetical protein [Glaciihabitans sp. UYNi722]|uniref:hypothetical protein n=1 Tax=Glaciihabitans sp. UYNi722 TaxID=3156344 RepID=UPI003399E0BC
MIPEIVAELDRQLSEQRASAESLATRSGLLIAASAAILGFAAAGNASLSPVGYWILGIGMVLGVMVFWMARVGWGPNLSVAVSKNDAKSLARSKLILVEANKNVLTRAQVIFTLQVLLTILGIAVLALVLWRLP